jgi:thiol-disulfide isomerase/thioredoxin
VDALGRLRLDLAGRGAPRYIPGMATPSTMLELGTPVPDFSLVDVRTGETVSLADFADARGLLVMFICNHCPFVKHVRGELAALGRDYDGKGLAIVAINSNDATTHPQDGPPYMKAEAAAQGYGFPYLFDEGQEVAKAFRAACTPDFYVFDRDRRLAYRGQLDGSRPGNRVPVTGADLRAACDAVLDGASPAAAQTPSVGCNIKWRAGNAPDYYG